jgi:hypothetical protein
MYLVRHLNLKVLSQRSKDKNFLKIERLNRRLENRKYSKLNNRRRLALSSSDVPFSVSLAMSTLERLSFLINSEERMSRQVKQVVSRNRLVQLTSLRVPLSNIFRE